MVLVVGRLNSVANVADLGRDLCARDDTTGDMELNGSPFILCQARAVAAAAAHRHSDECNGRAPRSHGLVAIIRQAAVRRFVVTPGRFSCSF